MKNIKKISWSLIAGYCVMNLAPQCDAGVPWVQSCWEALQLSPTSGALQSEGEVLLKAKEEWLAFLNSLETRHRDYQLHKLMLTNNLENPELALEEKVRQAREVFVRSKGIDVYIDAGLTEFANKYYDVLKVPTNITPLFTSDSEVKSNLYILEVGKYKLVLDQDQDKCVGFIGPRTGMANLFKTQAVLDPDFLFKLYFAPSIFVAIDIGWEEGISYLFANEEIDRSIQVAEVPLATEVPTSSPRNI